MRTPCACMSTQQREGVWPGRCLGRCGSLADPRVYWTKGTVMRAEPSGAVVSTKLARLGGSTMQA